MNKPPEPASTGHEAVDRSRWTVERRTLGEAALERSSVSSPEERLGLVWPLTVQAWAFRGVDVAQSRLPRHLMRITRRVR